MAILPHHNRRSESKRCGLRRGNPLGKPARKLTRKPTGWPDSQPTDWRSGKLGSNTARNLSGKRTGKQSRLPVFQPFQQLSSSSVNLSSSSIS